MIKTPTSNPLLYTFVAFCVLLSPSLKIYAQERDHARINTENWPEINSGIVLRDETDDMPVWKKVLLYPVNRGADFLDCFCLQFGFGLGGHLIVRATDLVQLGGGAAAVSKLGTYKRQMGLMNESKAEVAIFPFNPVHEKQINAFGTFKEYRSSEDFPWRHQVHQDYFGIGVDITALIVSLKVEAYPVELIDLISGFAGFDLKHDDLPHRSDVRQDTEYTISESKSISRVAIVPSRIVKNAETRLTVPSGMGVYYHRYPQERLFGLIGGALSHKKDAAAAKLFSGLIKENDFDLVSYLLQNLKIDAQANMGWHVADVDALLDDYRKHAVEESHKGQTIRRLPDYAGLCEHYKVDAVLDVRIWEWGIMRKEMNEKATVYLDVEMKLIKYPERTVVFDARLTSDQKGKEGQSLHDLARENGMPVIRESEEAADIINTKFIDLISERP